MSIISRMRKEKAVWWAVTGLNRYGEETFAAPVEINCRWEDINEVSVDINGDEFTTASIVYVDREMKPDDMLWRGELADAPVDPKADRNAWPIRSFEKLPTLDYKEFLLTAKL